MKTINQPEKILITIDRELMSEYHKYYFKTHPTARTVWFAKNITEKLFNKDGTPQLNNNKTQKTKSRPRKKNECSIEDYLYGCLSLNDLLNLDPMAVGDKKAKWKEFGVWVATYYNLHKKGIENSTVEYVIYSETKAKKDLDNLAGGIKFLNDGLYVASGMFVDDSYQHINPLLISGEYDKNHPRTEIRITIFDKGIRNRYEKIKQHIHIWEKN